MKVVLILIALSAGLAACARAPEPGQGPGAEAVYPGQPVQTVVGTNYAASVGLPTQPRNAEGVVPPPPPRYMGSSASASSANVAAQ